MRVGVYVDAFNVYYGGKALARDGQATSGWKWIDLAGIANSLIDAALWPGATVTSLVYCSAPRSTTGDTHGSADQRAYFDALQAQSDLLGYDFHLELGRYVHTEKSGLVLQNRGGDLVKWSVARNSLPAWSGLRRKRHVDGVDYVLGDFKSFEEKGSDVNVATRLLVDVMESEIDAAIVFCNDSDLALPVRVARERVPVGLVNPSTRPTAYHLKASPSSGVGGHWWRRLTLQDLQQHQLPPVCGSAMKPSDW